MDIITLFPVRCITCNKVLGDKQIRYERLIKDGVSIKDALDILGIDRICCRTGAISAIQLTVPVEIPAESAIESKSGLLKDPLRKIGEWVRAGQPFMEAQNRLNPDEAQQINRILERLTQLLNSNSKFVVERLIQANQPLTTVVSKLELILPVLILPVMVSKSMIIDQLFFNLDSVPDLLNLLGAELIKIYTEYQENPDILAGAMQEKRTTQESDFFKSIYLTSGIVRDDPTNIIQNISPLLFPSGPAMGIIEEFIKAGLTFDQTLTLLGMDMGITLDLSVRYSAARILENIILLTPFYESMLTDLKITARTSQIGTGLEGDLERMSLQRQVMSTPGGALNAMTNRGKITSSIPGPGPSSRPVNTRPAPRMPGRSQVRMPGRPQFRMPGITTSCLTPEPITVETPGVRPPVRIPGEPPIARIPVRIPAAQPSIPAVPTAVAGPAVEIPIGPPKLERPPVPRIITLPTMTEFGLPIYRAV